MNIMVIFYLKVPCRMRLEVSHWRQVLRRCGPGRGPLEPLCRKCPKVEYKYGAPTLYRISIPYATAIYTLERK